VKLGEILAMERLTIAKKKGKLMAAMIGQTAVLLNLRLIHVFIFLCSALPIYSHEKIDVETIKLINSDFENNGYISQKTIKKLRSNSPTYEILSWYKRTSELIHLALLRALWAETNICPNTSSDKSPIENTISFRTYDYHTVLIAILLIEEGNSEPIRYLNSFIEEYKDTNGPLPDESFSFYIFDKSSKTANMIFFRAKSALDKLKNKIG
jgi:hypothetical protein